MILTPAIKIIIVDDDDGHSDLVQINLERSGLMNEIVRFSNGRKAVDFLNGEAAEKDKYLMLLDLNMPGWDGHQVLERLKQTERTRTIPIIVLTTAADEEEVAHCYALGCNFYMQKPIKYEAFCDAIHELGMFIQKTQIPGGGIIIAQEARA